MTAADICRAALRRRNVFDASDAVSADDMTFVLELLNSLLDSWNAKRETVYADIFNSYTFTPALSPHTIGPTGTFVVTQRPVSIDSCSLVFTSTNHPEVPITVRDADWYAGLSVPTLSSAVPTDVYYEPAWPNGKLFFYPIPSTAYGVSLQTRIVLAQLLSTTTFTLPPGYQEAITLTLMEMLSEPYEKPASARLTTSASQARAVVFANNRTIPSLTTQDSGMPRSGGPIASGNYLTGWYS